MNRCIACYRCVRYYKDYAGGTDLGVYGAHDNVYFGRVEDGVLESFSGNLTEVCPTGVFTDKTHSERYNRKWDMQFAPSICHGCSSGCNISPGERYGEIRRIENRYNGSVNHYFLCDRGRFGYGYVNREDRPRQPLLVLSKQKLSLDGALDQAAALLKERKVVGIGSPRASLESNFALRELVGEGNFCSGINEGELDRLRLILQVMQEGPLPVPSIRDIEDHDAVFVLGEDLTQTAARIALALRQSVKGKAVEMAADMKVQPWLDAAVKNIAQHAQNPLFIASVSATRLDDVAEETVHAAPDDLARLGFAVAHAIDPSAPAVADLDPQAQAFAQRIADALLAAKRPLVVSGNSLGNKALIEAAANIAKALNQREKNGSISLVVGEAATRPGALRRRLRGSRARATDLRTGRRRGGAGERSLPPHRRRPCRRSPGGGQGGDRRRSPADRHHRQGAPGAAGGQLRRRRRHPGQPGRPRPALPGVRPDLLRRQEHGPRGLALAACDPQHPARQARRLDPAGPRHRSRGRGQADPGRYPRRRTGRLVPHQGPQAGPRTAPQRGRTAMRANISVHEPRTPQDIDSAFAFSMEGYSGSQEDRQQIPFAWSPGWNSPQAWNKFQDEVGGHLRAGDPGVRLIEPKGEGLDWFQAVPVPFSAKADSWKVVPLYHLFGSEENSSRAAPIQQRIPETYVALSKEDADRLGVNDGATLGFQLRARPCACRCASMNNSAPA